MTAVGRVDIARGVFVLELGMMARRSACESSPPRAPFRSAFAPLGLMPWRRDQRCVRSRRGFASGSAAAMHRPALHRVVRLSTSLPRTAPFNARARGDPCD